jgi:putative transposase
VAEPIRKMSKAKKFEAVSLGELIHQAVRVAIERAVHEELAEALGAEAYERGEERRGYRNGRRERVLSGPTGPVALTVPRATLFGESGKSEWSSKMLPRYQRRLPELNEAIVATYLSGTNTRRIRGALKPLLNAAPLSKSSVSRVVSTLQGELEAWRKRSLSALEPVYLYLDGFALRVRSGGKVVSVPVLGAVAVLADGNKQLLSLEMCGGESHEAWKGFLDELVARGLKSPVLCIIDGNPGLRRAVELTWPKAAAQRCTVHKLRNLERKAPKHAREEIATDYHAIVYAESESAARAAWTAFEKKWKPRCPGVARSLAEGSDELLTFFRYPKGQWKTIRTTNVIERLNEEFRRRVKTQGSLPGEEAALVLLFSLVASGQIKLRKLDGFRRIAEVLSLRMPRAA